MEIIKGGQFVIEYRSVRWSDINSICSDVPRLHSRGPQGQEGWQARRSQPLSLCNFPLSSPTDAPPPLCLVLASHNRADSDWESFSQPALVGNCAAWLFYGFEVMNWWIIMPNISGICIGLFYLLSAWPLCSPAQQKGFTTTLSLYGALFAATVAGLRLGLISACHHPHLRTS